MSSGVAPPPTSPELQTVLDHPLIHFGREVCGDLPAALRREWLVANGLGGYASGTLAGVNTRRYHGLLVVALTPPVGRTAMVGGLIEWASYDSRRYPLSTHEYGDGTVDPHGYLYLEAFALDGMLPVWTFALGDALLEKRVWMAYGANTTYVLYRLVRGTRAVELEIAPLVTYRDFHTLTSGGGVHPEIEALPRGVVIRASAGAVPFRVLVDEGRFIPAGNWYRNFRHREETARGLDDRSDLYVPGTLRASLLSGGRVTIVMTADAAADTDGSRALAGVQVRQRRLLQIAGVEDASPVVQQLTLAADQFIVRRGSVADGGPTLIAGYHWFNDWGRDTMIALPGLTLATGRPVDAAGILRTFARFVADGLIPNNFPDHTGGNPAYNTADASLWYVLAVRAYHEATGDNRLVEELLPLLREMIEHHMRGTRYGIGMDPGDGLLRAGEPGLQLTWMDAKVGEGVVTPRTGKPVEINALWYNALRTVAAFLSTRGDSSAQRYTALANRARASFQVRFVRAGRDALADVVDGPGGDDLTLRPNQILAVSLPFPLLERAEGAAVVDAVGRTLLTTYGLRSLTPDHPDYRGRYGGDAVYRDRAYHQGSVWAWLIGVYAEAHYRVYGDPEAALRLLRPFEHHLGDAGLGTVSEIFEGDPPHLPGGCIAQAWSVAEVMRVWDLLARASSQEE